MNLNRVGIIYRKELIDALSDRRTLISTIVLQILMFPVLTISFGLLAARSMQKILRDYRDQVIETRLMESGLTKDLLKPFASQEENVAAPELVGGNVIGVLFPYLIIFLCFMGALAPAIDLTAGEKERGTIETILASPVSRADLVMGKFLMVFTASIVTAVVSLTSFALTFSLPFLAARELSGGRHVPFSISLPGVTAMLLLMLPLAVMFAA